MSLSSKIRVLVVDDSPLARKVITRALGEDAAIEIVATAADAYEARDKILELNPDVITLDIEMPRMDGISFLKILMKHHPVRVVIVSALTQTGSAKAYEAMEAGAVEVLGKPAEGNLLSDFELDLVQKVKSAGAARLQSSRLSSLRRDTESAGRISVRDQVILFGASTGGVEALKEVLSRLPGGLPPICIVQHIPAYISGRFAARLNEISSMEVREAVDGDTLRPGLALLAPGGWHMLLRRVAGTFHVELSQTPPVNYQRPAVDVLFNSAAQCAGARAVGVLLTGMGKDGAQGMRRLKDAGAPTIAQNEETCVVYGMPRAAVELGAVRHVLPLERIPACIMRCLESRTEQ